jgi:hypothetical protein
MNINQRLVELFESYCQSGKPVRVSFENAVYDLRILSTMHAEEGGDVVADVLRIVKRRRPDECWDHSAMNFNIRDVMKVEAENECLFTKAKN